MTERIGPYRVYERLGVGGMGEVFKAYDDRLDRWVAIKRIRPDRLDAEDNRERFKREARATARLNHPSIVHLYGIFQDDEDADCIVMEFVDGRTLDTFLAEGPLSPSRVARLGHEVASGLAEAHANGILHRDLKAENIMITPRGRAKILDFGLAKPILASELDPVLTSKGQLVGTSRAMSPEYVSGEEVDHRSDLFALGVLLYECLTGQSPFKAHNTLATLKQVMLHKQRPVHELNPEVSYELSDLIDRLLSKDPSERPQNAEEVALAFGRVTGQVSSGIIDTPNFGSGTHPRATGGATSTIAASDTVLDLRPRNRRFAVIGILLVALIGAFFLGRQFVGGGARLVVQESKTESGINLVLGQFANNTEEEMLGASITEAFRAVLEQSRANTVLSESQIRDALGRMQLDSSSEVTREIGREICQREGAERLITGTVSKIGTSYSLVVNVVDPITDLNVFSESGNAPGDDLLLDVIETLAQNVRSHLGESATEIEKNAIPLEKVTTPDIAALKAYSLGVRKFFDNEEEEAVELFKQALKLDSQFAMAHARLGVIFANEGDPENALKHFDLALINDDRLSDVQGFYINGWKARWSGDGEAVISNWSTMRDLYPENYAANFNLGMALWTYRHSFIEASEAFSQAADLSQGSERSLAMAQKGLMLLAAGRDSDAEVALNSSDDPARKPGLFAILVGKRDYEAAKRRIAEMEDSRRRQVHQALLSYAQGSSKTAASDLAALVEDHENSGARLTNQALLDLTALSLKKAGESSESRDLVRKALDTGLKSISNELEGVTSSAITMLALVGKLAARHGHLDLARQARSTIEPLTQERQIVAWNNLLELLNAEIALAEGRLDDAIQTLSGLSHQSTSIQVTESLATAFARSPDQALEAVEILKGLSEQRARAIAEASITSSGLIFNLMTVEEAKQPILPDKE
ncbi:MAG: protein kinase [Acidobacteriota bacterium]